MSTLPQSPRSATATSDVFTVPPKTGTTSKSATSHTSARVVTHPVRRMRVQRRDPFELPLHCSKQRRSLARPSVFITTGLFLVLYIVSRINSSRTLSHFYDDSSQGHQFSQLGRNGSDELNVVQDTVHERGTLSKAIRSDGVVVADNATETTDRQNEAVQRNETVEENQSMIRTNVTNADETDYLLTNSVSNPLFKRCSISSDHSILHASLRRGPDRAERKARAYEKQPRDLDQVFATIDRRRYYYHPDRPAVRTVDDLGAGLDTDMDDAIKVATSVMKREIGPKLVQVKVPICYMRNTREDGVQTIVNIIGAYRTKKGLHRVRRMVTVTRGFSNPCEVSYVQPKEAVKLHVIVAYSKRPARLRSFLALFARYFRMSNTYSVRIIVSTTESELEDVQKIRREFAQLTDARFVGLASKGDRQGNFSRAVAMREGAKLVPSDEVMFLADADLLLGGNFLENCRVNIMRGHQVWFPVMFSLYPYGKGISSRSGIWRRSSYGMACMYGSDFERIGGFGGDEETEFDGWGSEDVALYNQFRDDDKYGILRTVEPGMMHKWHGKDCERNENYEDCMRTVYMTVGSQDELVKLMSKSRVDISSLTKNAAAV